MSFDPMLPRDPLQAAAILATLEHKNENECCYPTCHDPRQTATGTGRPPAFCSNSRHNAVNAHRARQQLLAAATEASTTQQSKRNLPSAPMAKSAESIRGSVLNRIALLQSDLERYVEILLEMSDPEISAAQIQAVLDQANSRVAEIQQALSSEQALRLQTEKDLVVAQKQVQVEREAAEQAITHMEEVETDAQRRMDEAEQRIKEIQRERDTTLEHLRTEAQQQIAKIEQQAKEAVAQAEQARAQATAAERLVNEAHASLERERTEIDRLRKELEEVRTRAQADLQEERRRDQADQEHERAETDRLREELATIRKQAEQATTRADTLASVNDQLRSQLIQIQIQEKGQSNQPSGK